MHFLVFTFYRTLAAFILATIVHNFPEGQHKAEKENLISICLEHLDDPEPVLRQWLAIAVGRVWDKYEKARWRGVRDNAHEKLYDILQDPVPEVKQTQPVRKCANLRLTFPPHIDFLH